MNQPKIFDGHLHAPFFIFFRRDPRLTDEQVLAHFGLTTHRHVTKLPPSTTYAVIADAGDWTMLADDWFYQLWYMPSTRVAIESLAKTRDLFTWSIGECDESFEYCLYRCGQLVRQYTVDSPHFDDQLVRINFGECLPFESELLASDVPIEEKMNRFCSNLGINPIVTQDMLRLYSKPYESQLDPNVGIRNF
ncbi:MAG: hypothetical protein MUE44_07770 [Oscillatoriaceae cyanobacterium Prado104]|jgi:hypothetical protein|nr:hypothetical protein [Oscillatoriaceae cyanobacterium Prado104]